MLMALGPFRFTIPTYSVEDIQRSMSARIAQQEVIGARPRTHLLGPGVETITLSSTFYPFHLNGAGLAQLEGMRAACAACRPLIFLSVAGRVFGLWVIKEVSEGLTLFSPHGVPQQVTVNMTMERYVGHSGGGLRLF
jgi:uncharacterized protein